MVTQLYDLLGPRFPFGRGLDGNATLSSDPHTRRTGSATSGTNTMTISSGAYTNGRVILAIQHLGLASSSEENWEVNQIVSGGGTTSLTMKNNWGRTYSSCQVIDVKEYANLTVNNFTATAWSGSTGGLVAFAVRGTCTWAGTITISGANGGSSISDQGGSAGNGGGFRGGWNSADGSDAARGEAYTGTFPSEGTSNQGNGGGGGGSGGDKGGAGGGGIGAGGSNAGSGSAVGGTSVGNSLLTSANFGGGGGGGKNDGDQNAGGGGNGGGGVICWIRVLTYSSGGVNLNGGTGGSSTFGATSGGGGGGGGFGLFNVLLATFNSSGFTALAGSGQNTGGNGGNGGFRINYAGSYSGSTNPSPSAALNSSLRPAPAGSQVVGA